MPFVISNQKHLNWKKIGKIYFKDITDAHITKKSLTFIKGETYPKKLNASRISCLVKFKGINEFKKLKGEFFVIHYDRNLEKIYIVNDILGRETLYYYYYKNKFLLSDDFWTIVSIIEPNEKDIDTQSIKELVVFQTPLFHKTIIKNLKIFPPASIGEFLINKKRFKIKPYWKFKYKPDEKLTLEDASERLYNLLDKSFKELKLINSMNAVYGIGLSGGLDCRIIPHFLIKNKMKVKSFIIGESRPNKLFLARDHLNAKKIAKYYNIQHFEIEYNKESLKNKFFYDVRYYPICESQVFLASLANIPKFDILVTGMNVGEFFGSTIPLNILSYSRKKLVEEIIRKFSYLPKISLKAYIRWFLKFLFGKISSFSEVLIIRDDICGVITKKEYNKIKKNIRNFLNKKKKASNIDLWQNFLLTNYIAKNKNNVFNLFNTKKNYSLFYHPHVIEECLIWKPEFLINRKLQKYFLLTKFPELAKIPGQNYRIPIYYENKSFKFIRKIRYMIEYFIRSYGVIRFREWVRKKEYEKHSFKILLKPNKIFNKIFSLNKIIYLRKTDAQIYMNLVKIKIMLDIIESRSYRNLIQKF